ncbi:MAG: hypothetical protein LKF96_03355 [Treponema sp.]|jgi:hypothetical protein|nr:hypothetical protein [Treponema sp.]
MKKKVEKECYVVFWILFVNGIETLFAQAQFHTPVESAVRTASFGVFSVPYDYGLNLLYWTEVTGVAGALHTGINDNQLNACVSGIFGPLYGAFRYSEKITNYKAWPDNMTDEEVALLLGFRSGLGFRIKYYDFCYSDGKGTAMPSLAVSKIFPAEQGKRLRSSFEVDMGFRYCIANIMDLFQPRMTFHVDYGTNAGDGCGIIYQVMPTLKGTHNRTDVSSIPVYQKLENWYGKTWFLGSNLRVGIRPDVFVDYNAVNPSVRLYNVIPDKGNMEFHARLPFSFLVNPGEKVEYAVSFLVGLYYANFDHQGTGWPGGNNNSGWVPELGAGAGFCMNVNKHCSIQMASNFIRIPELTGSNNTYSSENISVANMVNAPLSLSSTLFF